MKLWIRSQDKDYLIKVKGLLIEENNNTCQIFGDSRYLGTYNTKERAIEVLDEIANILETNKLFELYSNIGRFPNAFNENHKYVEIYQMPMK